MPRMYIASDNNKHNTATNTLVISVVAVAVSAAVASIARHSGRSKIICYSAADISSRLYLWVEPFVVFR